MDSESKKKNKNKITKKNNNNDSPHLLSYKVDDIIPKRSASFFHRRPLINAESMFKKGHFLSSIEIYNRVLSKIHDKDAKEKIKQNIEDIEKIVDNSEISKTKWKKKKIKTEIETDTEFEFNKSSQPTTSSENGQAVESVTESTTASILGGTTPTTPGTAPASTTGAAPATPGTAPASTTGTTPATPGIAPASTTGAAPATPGTAPASTTGTTPATQGTAPASTTGAAPATPQTSGSSIGGININIAGGDAEITKTPGADGQTGSSGLSIKKTDTGSEESQSEALKEVDLDDLEEKETDASAGTATPSIPKIKRGKKRAKRPNLSESDFGEIDEEGEFGDEISDRGFSSGQLYNPLNDFLSSVYFSNDWSKFSDLPLADRRKENDRRQEDLGPPDGIERRTGEDRREQDLLDERQQFLESLKGEMSSQGKLEGGRFVGNGGGNGNGGNGASSAAPSNGTPTAANIEQATNEAISKPEITQESELRKLNLPESDEHRWLPFNENVVYYQETKPELESLQLPGADDIFLSSDIQQRAQNLLDSLPVTKPEMPSPNELVSITEDRLKRVSLPDAINEKWETEEGLASKDVIAYEEVTPPLEVMELPAPRDIYLAKELEERARDLDDYEPPEIVIDGDLGELPSELPEGPDVDDMVDKVEEAEPPEPEKVIHGILELKPPEVDDAPFLTLTYDFSKIPDSFKFSKDYSIMEYSYYKYKSMLLKAQEFARRKMLKNALNYYRVIEAQNIPPELKKMIDRNITDISEFLEKYLMAKGG